MAAQRGLPLPGTDIDPNLEPPRPFTVEDFGGLDTKAKRPAVGPKDFPWIYNWMPLGAANMRTLPDNGTAIYTTTGPRTIVHAAIYNIASARYAMLFLDDGSAKQINLDTNAVVSVAGAGTFYATTERPPAAAQYQSKYLVVASQHADNSYWVWDGALLFTAGTLAPTVTLTNAGSGYASAPTVTAFGGSGSGATFSATVAGGVVTDIVPTAPGTGYLDGDLVTVVISGGGSDTQARCTATVSTTTGGVGKVTVTAGGSGYSAPLVTFAGGGGAGAKAFVSGAANGVVTEITVTDPGTGYTSNPTVTIADSGGGVGAGATALAETRRGVITGITVNSGGSGYVGVPDVVISAPNDSGFPQIQAEAIATIAAGAVTAITLTNHGLGYKSASVRVEGGNNAANAEVSLMPFGIQGSTLETYQDRVWVGDLTKFSYTGAGSVTDFSTAGGGGSQPVIDSFLREHISRFFQSNGFLYSLGDSSVNVISNVQTSSSGVTTFNNSNVDPQTGTDWPNSVVAFGRAIVFANPSGVYALYGGAAEKVSAPLDGLFANAVFTESDGGRVPTGAVATIYGIRVYQLLITSINPFTGALEDMMCCWDGQRWFVATQSTMPNQIVTQEINSILTTWGITDTKLLPLFQTPSNDIKKVFQTKLVANPGYYITDQVTRVYFLAETNLSTAETLDIALDNEQGSNPAKQRSVSKALRFIGAGGAPIQFTGLAGADLNFTSRGLTVAAYDDTQFGALLGATVSTFAEDMTMVSLTLLLREYAPIG